MKVKVTIAMQQYLNSLATEHLRPEIALINELRHGILNFNQRYATSLKKRFQRTFFLDLCLCGQFGVDVHSSRVLIGLPGDGSEDLYSHFYRVQGYCGYLVPMLDYLFLAMRCAPHEPGSNNVFAVAIPLTRNIIE